MLLNSRFLALLLTLTLPATAQQVADPANLMGERVSPPALADTLPIDHGAPALEQLLRKLRTRASMMLIVAHPDDEDGGLLTYESRGMGARVAMLTLNRGEGGQNLMSGDFDDALGLIRTQELLAADRYMGVDQFFGTEVDFGFSKTKEESLAKWTHERVLYDAVRCVRLYRPLVIASVFIGGPTDGHGQHQVSGEIAQEVFTAAADPKVFPEMGLPPWAPLRVYARVPFARIGPDGMFDYATGKTIPPSFHNYVTGVTTSTPPRASVTIHEGETPTIPAFHGLSYIQWARQGLALQKTQIGEGVRVPPAGAYDVGYTLYGSRAKGETKAAPGSDLFAGIDTSVEALAELAPGSSSTFRGALQSIDRKVAEAQRRYDPAHLEQDAPPLRDALQALDGLIDAVSRTSMSPIEQFNLLHELRIKRVQMNDALVLALGLQLESMSKPEHLDYALPLTTADKTLYANVRIRNGRAATVQLLRLCPAMEVQAMLPAASARQIAAGESVFAEATISLRSPVPTRPYFSRNDLEQPFYSVAEKNLRNAPSTPDPLVASALVEYQGVPLELRAVLPSPLTVARRTASSAATSGASEPVPQAAVFIPPVSLSLRQTPGEAAPLSPDDLKRNRDSDADSSVGVLPLGSKSFSLGARLAVESFEASVPGHARVGPEKIPVTLQVPAGWQVSAPSYDRSVEPVVEHFTVTPDALKRGESYRVTANASHAGRTYTEGYRPVGYPGLTYTNYYRPASYRVTAADVKTAPQLRIGYVPGTGDEVPEFLPELGVVPTILTVKDLSAATLAGYDAILLGVRAYAAHPELAGKGSAALNEYARGGGVVIAQYNSGGFDASSAPFPYTLPGDPGHNVVEESRPVTFLVPDSPLLTWPNQITPADFDHWVEERGHGFASGWAPEYQPLLEVHDTDQDPQRGGLLVAKTGKGAYVYCAFALYRQLPEGVPGAYRLMANLLSYAKNPRR